MNLGALTPVTNSVVKHIDLSMSTPLTKTQRELQKKCSGRSLNYIRECNVISVNW